MLSPSFREAGTASASSQRTGLFLFTLLLAHFRYSVEEQLWTHAATNQFPCPVSLGTCYVVFIRAIERFTQCALSCQGHATNRSI